MIELLTLGALAVAGVFVVSILALVFAVLKFVFWIVLLPIRLAFKLLFLPLLLLKWAGLALLSLVAAPILVVVLLVGGAVVVLGMLAPLLPVVFLVLAVWALVRLGRRPAVV